MKQSHSLILLLVVFGLFILGGSLLLAQEGGTQRNYLPAVHRAENTPTPEPTATPTPPPTVMTEFRGIWLTRFEWTGQFDVGTPERINEIVDNIAYAGFNAIFFQVRGTGDAFYTPGLEPWSGRLNSDGQLGIDPGWDPLQTMINRAKFHNIQVHAYINVYPLWTCAAPPETTPRHLYHQLAEQHGVSDGRLHGVQWADDYQINCTNYLYTSPASLFVDEHLLAVGKDLVTRYDVDGLHLDYIRYSGRTRSCDPVSEAAFGGPCFSGEDGVYANWQRAQVNGTVWKFYQEVVPLKPGLLLSTAVWPQHIDHWDWGGTEGYHDYYQDSKAWLAGGYVDAITPMIYGSSFWDQNKWEILAADFQAAGNGRFVYAGIGADHEDFNEIRARIERGRELGLPGHAIFSYSALAQREYFDDLRHGPYALPAVPPEVSWR